MRKRNQPNVFSTKRLKNYLISFVFALFLTASLLILENTNTYTPPKAGSTPELYASQLDGDLTHTFTSAIKEANQSVLLIVYSLTDPKIIACLKEKSRQGIPVKVICDAKASPYIDSKLGPKVQTTRRFGPGLMHQKILVVDNKKTWIGSANMTSDSLRLHGNLVTGFDSPHLAENIIAKAQTIDVEGRGPAFNHQDFNIGGQLVELWFLPDNKEASLKIKSLIRGAQKTLRIAMFTWTRYDLAKAVIAAAKRGVDTQVVIDHYSGKGASEIVVKMLKENGVDIALSRGGPLLHHKFMYIDGNTLVNGSANWTKAAFTQNDDCFIVINGITNEQKMKMDSVWQTIWKESSKQ